MLMGVALLLGPIASEGHAQDAGGQNRDDSWLHLIDAQIGATFMRDFDTQRYVPEGPGAGRDQRLVGRNGPVRSVRLSP